jgi:hypothetical protein
MKFGLKFSKTFKGSDTIDSESWLISGVLIFCEGDLGTSDVPTFWIFSVPEVWSFSACVSCCSGCSGLSDCSG